jgi:hypothetical protein
MQELVIEAGRGEPHYWQDLWRYRELPSASMARCFGALHTDGDRHCLAADPTIPDDGALHNYRRQDGQAAVRWYRSLCAEGLHGHATVELFSNALSHTSKPAQQRASDQQGVLPKIDRVHCAVVVGLLHQLPHSGGK